MYGKIINNTLQYAPRNYTLDSGGIITNFNKSISIMKQYGYKEIIDTTPAYDETTQYIKLSGYTDNEDNITINYEVINRPTPLPTKMELLEQQVNENTEAIADTQFAIDFILFGDTGMEGGE